MNVYGFNLGSTKCLFHSSALYGKQQTYARTRIHTHSQSLVLFTISVVLPAWCCDRKCVLVGVVIMVFFWGLIFACCYFCLCMKCLCLYVCVCDCITFSAWIAKVAFYSKCSSQYGVFISTAWQSCPHFTFKHHDAVINIPKYICMYIYKYLRICGSWLSTWQSLHITHYIILFSGTWDMYVCRFTDAFLRVVYTFK